jgi:hypothetical protein
MFTKEWEWFDALLEQVQRAEPEEPPESEA